MFRVKGLRRRWVINAVGVVAILGLVCVLAVTTAFAAYYYAAIESDMRYRARTTTDYFADYLSLNSNDFYQSCITYAQTFEDKNNIELQFINAQGRLVATSYSNWTDQSPNTPEIAEAVSTRGITSYIGRDNQTGERIISVASPMVHSNGDVIGALRYVTSTRLLDLQIAYIAAIAFVFMLVVLFVVLLSSNYYIRSILLPIGKIVEKAQMIANGSYGIQIESKYDDEIGELAETINDMSLKISENEKIQTEFISSLSHELRTPLTAITGWSETLLSSDSLDISTRRGVKIIHREAGRLTDMVLELLDFNRIQEGRMTLNIELTDIRSEFEDTVFMYGSRLEQDGITIAYKDSDEDIPEIPCDAKRLRQVFLNILDNAAKHGGEGKVIEAELFSDANDIIVRIRDFGPGIPEDELPLVKKKFYKGSSKARGSGIGLAVCDEIVTMHGGSLILENAETGGTVVTVSLPISQ